MHYAKLMTAIAIVSIFMLTIMSPAHAVCFTSKPKITTKFDLQETRYDFSKSVKDIATVYSQSRQSELAFGTYTNNFNVKIGNIEYASKEKKYDKNSSFCVHLKSVEIIIGIRPVIKVPIEAYKRRNKTCFEDILEHEKGHDEVTRNLIQKYDKIAVNDVEKKLSLKKRYKIAETNNESSAKRNYINLIVSGLQNTRKTFSIENAQAQDEYHDEVSSSTDVCGFLYETALQGKKEVYDYFKSKE